MKPLTTGPTNAHVLLCSALPGASLMFGPRLLEAVRAAAQRYGFAAVVIDHDTRQVWGVPPAPHRHLQVVPE